MVICKGSPNYRKLSIRLPVCVYNLLKEKAQKEKQSLNSELICLLEAGITRQEAKARQE